MNPRIAAVIFAFCSLMPLGVAQATSADIDLLPGVSLHLGDRDQRGNYWDGYDWRDQRWWQDHQGRDLGERNRHGHYWDGHRWQNRDSWQKNYYYREGRYWKYDKHHDNHGKKHHRGKGHERHHDDD